MQENDEQPDGPWTGAHGGGRAPAPRRRTKKAAKAFEVLGESRERSASQIELRRSEGCERRAPRRAPEERGSAKKSQPRGSSRSKGGAKARGRSGGSRKASSSKGRSRR